MCGIFAYIGKNKDKLQLESSKIKHRGPDVTKIYNDKNVYFKFHRLCICDKTENGNQPMYHPTDNNLLLMCNGEIYNHNTLKEYYNIETESKSDCEIILHLYKLIGIESTIKQLDGVFAFLLYDIKHNIILVGRDKFGVRPMYYGTNKIGEYYFSSEIKSLVHVCDNIKSLPPGSLWKNKEHNNIQSLIPIKYDYIEIDNFTYKEILLNIYSKFEEAVIKRLMGDREIGCFLSGGLDSSLVTALACKHSQKQIQTFSIGLKGSTDLKYASQVAKYLNTNHHEVHFTEKEGIDAISHVIYYIESYDITTIRASVGMYLLSKYIKENTNVKVVLSGEGSDELTQGYIYFHNSPNPKEAHEESVRLLSDLYRYDILRSDKTTASQGLEVRVPFLDKNFVDFYMKIQGNIKIPQGKHEKYLLRKAFDNNILPKEVLWRAKEAFSDGVSSLENSWYEIIQKHVNTIISDKELNNAYYKYTHNTPLTKEAYWYRELFTEYFGNNNSKLIPYMWMPRWSKTSDPSARSLSNYIQ